MLRRRIILLVPLLALFAFVATTEKRAEAADTTPPETTITSGPSGSVSGTTATFAFISNEAGSTFRCKLKGQDSTRTTCTTGKTYTNLTAGTKYTFKVWATDAAGNIDPTPATRTFTPSGGGGGGTAGSPHLVGAGDIATDANADVATGDLIDARPEAIVFTAGDNAYPNGSASDYADKYEPAWGAFKARTKPSPGNHEYYTSNASGYKTYFGSLATPEGTTYYAYDLGDWRIYSLDSAVAAGRTSPQYQWLQNDLAANARTCMAAYWHHPIASSGVVGNMARMGKIFALLDSKGADLVLSGHDHNYERFTNINSSGAVDPNGMREIVVGTGGAPLGREVSVQPGSEVRNFDTHGIVDIALSSTGYSGTFVPAPGFGSFTDSFSGTCGT